MNPKLGYLQNLLSFGVLTKFTLNWNSFRVYSKLGFFQNLLHKGVMYEVQWAIFINFVDCLAGLGQVNRMTR